MKHCLVLAPFLLSSAAAFTGVNQQFQSFLQIPTSASSLQVSNFDYHGTSDRIGEAYTAWCRVYNKSDTSRLEIFAYHFLLAEKFFGQTGAPVKLNEHADLTSTEYMKLQETGSLSQVPAPTEVIVSKTKASDYAMPEPIAPANYGPSASSYLEALGSGSNALSGAGMTSYLDTVPKKTTTLGGAGMTSYLDSVSGASPLSNDYAAASAPSPFAAATPAVVSSIPAPYVPPPAAPTPSAPASGTGNYMDNLSATSTAKPTGSGMTSYLDSVTTNGSVSGAGMTSYLDSVTTNDYTPFEATPAATPEPFVPPVPAATAQPIIPPPPPAQTYVPAESNTIVATGGNYMDNLSASSSSAPQGAGISSYLDTVPKNAAVGGGSGMTSYLQNMGSAADFATVWSPPAPAVPLFDTTPPAPEPEAPQRNFVPPAVQESIPPPAPVAETPAVQESIVPVAPVEPAYIAPAPSRSIPGGHWMDTITPRRSYGSREGGGNGKWDDSTNYQAANERYKRRQAARDYQQAQAQAYGQTSAPKYTPSTLGQQYQQQPSYQPAAEQQQQQQAPTTNEQESIAPLAQRVQRRQQRQMETFGGGFVVSY